MIPRIFYGTAWKEDRTERLVKDAIAAGFTAIDTANQRKHYYEEGVGRAIQGRDDLFIQTKFTFLDSQDHRLPYDPKAEVEDQVAQSFARSQLHLGREIIDSYVLHGPSSRSGINDTDRRAWRAMEALHQAGKVRHLGVSNVSRDQLAKLLDHAEVTPTFVQNRCYARTGWDRATRKLCAENGLLYQGFSLLTANPEVLADPRVVKTAKARGVPVTRVVFRFCLDVGMVVLTGTSDRGHMADDLAAEPMTPLEPEERAIIEDGF